MLNPQTSGFPAISQIERSWEQNLRAALAYLTPGSGAREGLRLGLPDAGLTPTLTDGYLIQGDQVLGPFGSKLITAIAASQSNKKLFFGLSGMYWGDENNAPLKPTDVLLGVVSSDADSIVHVAQPANFGAGRVGVRGFVSLEKATAGADQLAFEMSLAEGFENIRVTFAQARVAAAVTAGNDAGDDFVLKLQYDEATAVDLVTLDDAVLDDVGTLGTFAIADADAVAAHSPTSIKVLYNQTDGSTAIAGGSVEFFVEFALY